MQPLLDLKSPVAVPANADCAMFYSITNCQEGLRGISFGNLLIKQVAEDLKREFPHLRRFATLSPVPGFRRWLGEHGSPELLKKIEDPAWHLGEVPEAVQAQLTRLCARYLLHAKQGDEPLDQALYPQRRLPRAPELMGDTPSRGGALGRRDVNYATARGGRAQPRALP